MEIKKTGGDPHDVFCMGSGNLIDTAEDPMSRYICDDEDEDVKLERQKVEGYQPRETEQPGETEPVSYIQLKYSQFSPKYGVPVVSLNSGLGSAAVNTVQYVISWQIRPCYNDTRL